VFGECRRWFVRLEIGNSYGTLANKIERNPKVAIFLIQSQNIAIKFKCPDRSNVSPSAVVKGCNEVVPLMPISGNLRIQNIKGGFYVYERFSPSMPGDDGTIYLLLRPKACLNTIAAWRHLRQNDAQQNRRFLVFCENHRLLMTVLSWQRTLQAKVDIRCHGEP
jgi:hypothetical protein